MNQTFILGKHNLIIKRDGARGKGEGLDGGRRIVEGGSGKLQMAK